MAEEDAPKEVEETAPRCAVLFELENVAGDGRRIVFDVLKSVLADKGVKLTPLVFSKECLQPSVSSFLPGLLQSVGKTRLSEQKLLAEITEGIKLSFAGGSTKLSPGAAKLMAAASEHGIARGAVSRLDEDVAAQLMERLGLAEGGVGLCCGSDDEDESITPEVWEKLARSLSVKPALCVAVVTSADACRSALAAGMRCVVVPDMFTAFQDFGGADEVADTLDDDTIRNILLLLESS